METTDQRIQLRLDGSRTTAGGIEFDALLAFGDAFRRALRGVVRDRAGLPAVQPGHPANEVREASRFRLVGISEGSAVLELEPVESRLVADPTLEALQDLADGIAGRQRLDGSVVRALRDAVQSLGSHGRVGMFVPAREPVTFDVPHLDRLDVPTLDSPEEPVQGSVDGWLHAVDIDPDEVRIRDTTGRDWICHYPSDLEVVVRELIGEVVRAIGAVIASGTRARIEVSSIERLQPPAGVVRMKDKAAADVLRDAMATANVAGPQPISVLVADVRPDDPDELAFEEALRAIG